MDAAPPRLLAALFVILALPPFLLPLFNPDVFWHLSAGRWLAERGALPRRDFLSFTRPDAPWLNFEWLAQAVFYAAHAALGMAGLWLLKIALLGGAAAALVRVLALNGVSGAGAAVALALWAAGMLPHADIRPDLFSGVFFLLTLGLLERCRHGRGLGTADYAASLLLFALWANLHAAFAFGLGLTLCYLAGALLARRAKTTADRQRPRELAVLAAVQVAGTFLQPYGLGPYRVMLEHAASRADLARFIHEWQPMAWDQPSHMAFWPLAVGVLGLMAARARSRDFPVAPALAAAALACAALGHRRLGSFFVAVAVPLAAALARDLGRSFRIPAARAALALAAVIAAFWAWTLRPPIESKTRRGVFDYMHAPFGAAEFMASERAAFEGLRVYNPWEWGGYLGWRLRPWHKVFSDGRYLFHDLLPQTSEASRSPEDCAAFMARHGVESALLHNRGSRWRTTRVYPDKTTREFERPWYLFYFPKERWALVYWDAQSLLFVARARVPPRWLESVEYRYVRPDDDEAFQDALRRGELPLARVEAERARHKNGG